MTLSGYNLKSPALKCCALALALLCGCSDGLPTASGGATGVTSGDGSGSSTGAASPTEMCGSEACVGAGAGGTPGLQTPGDVNDPATPGNTKLSFLSQEGPRWVNEAGEDARLRGMNIGNWFILEFWMMGSPFEYSNGGNMEEVVDQCTFEAVLRSRFGQAEKERLMDLFRESWMQDRDWDNLKSLGMNMVRLPFIYHLVEDEEAPLTLRDDAFVWLDRAIDEAEKRGIYTILDLHGAAGGQDGEHHTGCVGENELWGSEQYRARTKWLWQQVAERYKDRGAVAGYSVLNEPWGTEPEPMAAFAWELYDAIRTVDDRHVVILPEHKFGLWPYKTQSFPPGAHDVAFDLHLYPGFHSWRDDREVAALLDVHNDWLDCTVPAEITDWQRQDICQRSAELGELNTPAVVGEFQPWAELGADGGGNTRKTYDVYNDVGWAAAAWSYKVVSHYAGPRSLDGWHWGAVRNEKNSPFAKLNIETASIAELEQSLSQFATQSLMVHPGVVTSMNE